MNYDKIKELAEQAGYLPDMFNRGHWDLPECHKFAELLIMECITMIQLSTARDPQNTVQYKQSVGHIHKIRDHFGINT
jgi:hypothetical protein